MNVPLCAANSLARFSVDDLNPTTGGIGLVPLALAHFGLFNPFFSIVEWGDENNEEGVERILVREKFYSDNLVPVGVRLDFMYFQRHDESIASVPYFLEACGRRCYNNFLVGELKPLRNSSKGAKIGSVSCAE